MGHSKDLVKWLFSALSCLVDCVGSRDKGLDDEQGVHVWGNSKTSQDGCSMPYLALLTVLVAEVRG